MRGNGRGIGVGARELGLGLLELWFQHGMESGMEEGFSFGFWSAVKVKTVLVSVPFRGVVVVYVPRLEST